MASLNDRITAGTVDEITTPAAGQRVAVSEDGDPGDKYMDVGKKLADKASLSDVAAEFFDKNTLDLTGIGDFTAGEIKLTKVFDQVIISAVTDLEHSEDHQPSTPAGFIPEKYRPGTDKVSIYLAVSADLRQVVIRANGSFELQYRDYSGVNDTRTSSGYQVTIAYNVA